MPLDIWFLNVGHGDCTVVQFPSGRKAMIDINNAPALDEESAKEIALSVGGLTEVQYAVNKAFGITNEAITRYEKLLVNPVNWWQTVFPGASIFRFIATHPDMDHLSGLYRLSEQAGVEILNFWDTVNSKSFSEKDFENSPYDYRDWQQYQKLRESTEAPKALRLHRDDLADYWNEDGISILAPTSALDKKAAETEDWNHLGYVLRVQYGQSVVILTGDSSVEALDNIYRSFSDDYLKAGLLSAPHHGRDTGFHEALVAAIDPTYTVVSVGKKPENDASNKYRKYSDHVYSTRFCGTIQARCWHDGDIWLYDHQGNRLE